MEVYRLKLSTKGRYGVKAMLDLAVHQGDEPTSIKTISKRQDISEYYLEQLFAPLRREGIIRSVRGAQGGYFLNRDPKDITVLEVINILEGPIFLSECLETEECSNIDLCATRTLWQKIKFSVEEVMESITLQDMLDDYREMQKSPIDSIIINGEKVALKQR